MTNRVTKQCHSYVKQGRNYQLFCTIITVCPITIHFMYLMFSIIFKLSLCAYQQCCLMRLL